MKLYVSPGAPNPTRVRLYVAEKNAIEVTVHVAEVTLDLKAGQQRAAAHLARNPIGKVPVLEIEDGLFLTESLAIIEYLEERFPVPPMLGTTSLERAKVRELDRIAELRVLLPLGRLVHATRSPMARDPDPAVVDHYRNMLPIGLQYINDRLRDGRPFIAGDGPTIADCTLAAALGFGRTRGIPIGNEHANVTAWFERYSARTAVKAVLAP